MASSKSSYFGVFLFAMSVVLAQEPSSTTELAPPSTTLAPSNLVKFKCAATGFMCSDCKNKAVCIDDGSGGLMQIENSCPSGTTCIENKCVEGVKCNFKPFVCKDQGFFPDPYDCTKYHACIFSKDEQYMDSVVDCKETVEPGEEASYNVAIGSCVKGTNNTACSNGPVPLCLVPLQTGSVAGDMSLYYVCKEEGNSIGPELYKCKGGKVFDSSKLSCVASKKSKK